MTNEPTHLINRLHELLRRAFLKDPNLNLSRLEQHIFVAGGRQKGTRIGRRQLKRLREGEEDVKLSLTQLKALNLYLIEHDLVRIHENPLFCPPHSLLDALGGEHRMILFYPARFLPAIQTEVASHWDLRAVSALQKNRQIGDLSISLQNVFHYGTPFENPAQLTRALREESWYRSIEAAQEPLLSLGSPFVCYSTEIMLCRMFGLQPFQPAGYSLENPLPFYLFWPDPEKKNDSAFAITREELGGLPCRNTARIDEGDRALLCGDRLYLAKRNGTSVNLLLTQYWNDHIVMALIGIFAPATFAIAQIVAQGLITEGPPRRGSPVAAGESAPRPAVQITLIETEIECPASMNGPERDSRRLIPDRTRIMESALWENENGRWQCR